VAVILQYRSAAGAVRSLSDIPVIDSAHGLDFEERAWVKIQQSDALYGDTMPWPKTHDKLRLRPGEVTAWIGPNRDGKSLLTGYLAAHWALQENMVLMCSLEMDVGLQLKRISRQLLCTETPQRSTFEMLLARLIYLNFLDFVGHKPPAQMLAIAREAGSRFRHVFIDNLTLIVPPGRNTDESSATFVRGLVEVARDTGCHIHLVGHVRKPEQDRSLNRYDWRGTGACADMVHNVVIVQANEKKRARVDRGDFSMADKPDVFLTIDKQRNGEYHGKLGFWWRAAALQLVEYGTDEPKRFDPGDFSMWER